MVDMWTSAPPAFPSGAPPSRLRPEATDATRYLCAAAHLDEGFARAVLDEVLHQPHRAIAPSHGISLIPIIRHAAAARRRNLLRDGLVIATLILGLVASFTVGVLVLQFLLSWWLIVRALRLLVRRQAAAALVYLVAAWVFLPLLTWGILIGSAVLKYGSYALSYSGFFLEDIAQSHAPVWVLLLLVIWGIYFAYRLTVHRTIAVELTPEYYDPQRAPALDQLQERHLEYIERAQKGNLTVYSEEIGHPFIGFGSVTQEWSLVTPLRPATSSTQRIYTAAGDGDTAIPAEASHADDVIPFTIDELYEAIRTRMAALADPRRAQDEVIPHLSVRDRVFLAGRLPVNSPFLDHGQPRYRLSESEVKDVQRTERGRLRHYQCVRMAAWDGELEVTTFLHASQRGEMLFVEFVATVVPGIRSEYHRIDTYDRLDTATTLRAAGRAAGDVFRSPLALGRAVAAGAARIRRALIEAADVKRINRQLMFDYGCRTSVREVAANFATPAQFQLYDANERVSIVDRRLLQVLVGFLKERHYDVTDLAGQAATVINSSRNSNTFNSNTNTFNNSPVNNSSIAAGSSASANVNLGAQSAGSSPAAGRPSFGGQS
jgi:hypothetical protein